MKKLFWIAVLLMSSSLNIYAQPGKGDVELGVDVGYNFFLILNSRGISGVNDGINFACTVDYYFSDRWSLKGKVIYDQKGWDGEIYFGPGFWIRSEYDKIYELNYITVPIMANLHFGKKRNWYVDFGPYVGFLLDAENNTTGSSIKNVLNPIDFGFAYGIGVKIPINNNLKFFAEIDEQVGFKNIFKDFNYDYNNEYGLNIRGSLNVGLIYQIEKAKSE